MTKICKSLFSKPTVPGSVALVPGVAAAILLSGVALPDIVGFFNGGFMEYIIQQIKPIDTAYDGCLFRSRLEARWAVFFNCIGVHYEYELEGFDLGETGKYLPDFFLPGFMGGAWAEIKIEPADLELDKILAVADYTGRPFIMLDGAPMAKSYNVYFPDIPEIFCSIWHIKYLPGGSHEDEYRMFVAPGTEYEAIDAAPMEAIRAARQARFDHGERPMKARGNYNAS